jgi:1,4-dihydroxy-2-naphthoate octaprenyltransferase
MVLEGWKTSNSSIVSTEQAASELNMHRISIAQALTAMPRVSTGQWQASSWIARWLISARASVLVMTFSSAAIGGLLALGTDSFDAPAWIACVGGLLLAHAANNQLNDLTDSVQGIDAGNYFRTRYGAHVLEDQLLTRRGLWRYIAATAGAALAIGIWLVDRVGPALITPLILGAVFLVFYTWPLKHWGLGEPSVLIVWGPLMVGGTYLAATGVWSWTAALVGTVFALGPTTVIFGKHIDKIAFDTEKGVRTFPVRIGATAARRWVQAMNVLQYVATFGCVAAGVLPWPVLLVALALPKARQMHRIYRREAPEVCPPDYPKSAWPLWYVACAFDHTRWFGLLFLVGLCAGLALA